MRTFHQVLSFAKNSENEKSRQSSGVSRNLLAAGVLFRACPTPTPVKLHTSRKSTEKETTSYRCEGQAVEIGRGSWSGCVASQLEDCRYDVQMSRRELRDDALIGHFAPTMSPKRTED